MAGRSWRRQSCCPLSHLSSTPPHAHLDTQVLRRFLSALGSFDWEQYCLALQGPLPLAELHSPHGEWLLLPLMPPSLLLLLLLLLLKLECFSKVCERDHRA